MSIVKKTALFTTIFGFFVQVLIAQSVETTTIESKFNPVETFTSIYTNNRNVLLRSSSGAPGAQYWQNSTDYKIKVSLNEANDEIKGTVELTYKNFSPDTLDFVWLYLEQNLFRKDSRGGLLLTKGGTVADPNGPSFEGGMHIYSVNEISNDGKVYTNTSYSISDTRMQVWLNKKVLPKTGKVTLIIKYSYICPKLGAVRTGIFPSKNGKIYTIAQWYPKMCVYDDLTGWNTVPYTGQGEFYSDYGDFDIQITAPRSHVVLCSGELLNPADVYSPAQLNRWNRAKKSDNAVLIRTGDDVESARKDSSAFGKTWHFRIRNARDAAWASSSAFLISAARINLPSGRESLAISAFPVESDSTQGWQRATEFGKASIEFSSKWFEYPYPTAISIAGNVGGMEYPGIVFCGWERKNRALWNVIDHEQGHNLFPIIVGSNEKLNGWMDEGLNVLMNRLSSRNFNNGEFRGEKSDMHRSAGYYMNPQLEPIINAVAHIKSENRNTLLYFKPATGLELLRTKVLGEERFDKAFKTYIHRWAFKHPEPEDFFRTMENVSGEDLSWFWRGWFFNNWQIDQAIKEVKTQSQIGSDSISITITNLEKLPMPVDIELTSESGKKLRIRLPIEVWESNISFTLQLPYPEELLSVELDPDKELPDINPDNNKWVASSVRKK